MSMADMETECGNVRSDLCGALEHPDRITNGDRLERADGDILCFSTTGSVIHLDSTGLIIHELALSFENAFLTLQHDQNLVYYDSEGTGRWGFSTVECASENSCFQSWVVYGNCCGREWRCVECTGQKNCTDNVRNTTVPLLNEPVSKGFRHPFFVLAQPIMLDSKSRTTAKKKILVLLFDI